MTFKEIFLYCTFNARQGKTPHGTAAQFRKHSGFEPSRKPKAKAVAIPPIGGIIDEFQNPKSTLSPPVAYADKYVNM